MISNETAKILNRFKKNTIELTCNGKCFNLDLIPIEKHKPDCAAVIAEQKQRLRKAEVGTKITNILLSNPKETKALQITKSYLNGAFKEGGLLIVAGGIGTGKTVAASYIISKVGGSFVYSGDLHRMFLTEKTEEFKDINFLVIDDLGVEYKKDFFESNLDALMYHRHKNILPTVITTNLTEIKFKEEYKGRIESRIREWGNFVNVIGQDMRQNQNNKSEKGKQIIN